MPEPTRAADDTSPSTRERRQALLIVGALVVAVLVLAISHPHDRPSRTRPVVHAQAPTSSVAPPTPTPARAPARAPRSTPTLRRPTAPQRQDPQDRPRSRAARRAGRALAMHRALQHVPYHHGHMSVRLTGARPDGRAVLTVSAPTRGAAWVGWRRFLARYRDPGRAYVAHFHAIPRRRR